MELPTTSTMYLAPLFVLILLFAQVLLRAVTSSLRHIPGPWYSRFTHLVLKYHVITGQRMYYIQRLHESYGPVVRIAPSEVDFSDLASFKEIHKIGGGYLKSPWYQSFRQSTIFDVFSMLDPKQHSTRRKLLARPFSNTSLRENWEPFIREKSELVVSKIREEAQDGNSDIYNWWTLMATDVINRLSFGDDPHMVQLGRRTEEVENLEKVTKIGGIRAELPWLYKLIEISPLKITRDIVAANACVDELGARAIRNAKGESLGSHNIFSGMINQSQKDDGKLREEDVHVEASGLSVAGSGTTAVTLTYLIWAVLSNFNIQKALREEVQALPHDFRDSDLEQSPILNAVIDETLRLYGAAPGSLPRIVPKGGANLAGYHIPGGTTVGTQAYSMHRNPDNFTDPDKFDYTRFLPENKKERELAAFTAFGAGSRTCLGVHLARMEMRYATAHFFRICGDAKLAPTTTPKSMEMLNFFLISPASGRCEITLRV